MCFKTRLVRLISIKIKESSIGRPFCIRSISIVFERRPQYVSYTKVAVTGESSICGSLVGKR